MGAVSQWSGLRGAAGRDGRGKGLPETEGGWHATSTLGIQYYRSTECDSKAGRPDEPGQPDQSRGGGSDLFCCNSRGGVACDVPLSLHIPSPVGATFF